MISWTTLKLNQYDDVQGSDLMLHNIIFNKSFYSQSNLPGAQDITMTAAFVMKNVNGAYPTIQMEGSQLLIGRYVIYKKFNCLAQVLQVNKN